MVPVRDNEWYRDEKGLVSPDSLYNYIYLVSPSAISRDQVSANTCTQLKPQTVLGQLGLCASAWPWNRCHQFLTRPNIVESPERHTKFPTRGTYQPPNRAGLEQATCPLQTSCPVHPPQQGCGGPPVFWFTLSAWTITTTTLLKQNHLSQLLRNEAELQNTCSETRINYTGIARRTTTR